MLNFDANEIWNVAQLKEIEMPNGAKTSIENKKILYVQFGLVVYFFQD